jgi:hypothetical protein
MAPAETPSAIHPNSNIVADQTALLLKLVEGQAAIQRQMAEQQAAHERQMAEMQSLISQNDFLVKHAFKREGDKLQAESMARVGAQAAKTTALIKRLQAAAAAAENPDEIQTESFAELLVEASLTEKLCKVRISTIIVADRFNWNVANFFETLYLQKLKESDADVNEADLEAIAISKASLFQTASNSRRQSSAGGAERTSFGSYKRPRADSYFDYQN